MYSGGRKLLIFAVFSIGQYGTADQHIFVTARLPGRDAVANLDRFMPDGITGFSDNMPVAKLSD